MQDSAMPEAPEDSDSSEDVPHIKMINTSTGSPPGQNKRLFNQFLSIRNSSVGMQQNDLENDPGFIRRSFGADHHLEARFVNLIKLP